MSEFHYCPACRGTKQIMGLGMIVKDCIHCEGIGYVEKHSEDHAEQNKVEDSEDTQTETAVDPSTPNRSKTKRQRFGKTALGAR